MGYEPACFSAHFSNHPSRHVFLTLPSVLGTITRNHIMTACYSTATRSGIDHSRPYYGSVVYAPSSIFFFIGALQRSARNLTHHLGRCQHFQIRSLETVLLCRVRAPSQHITAAGAHPHRVACIYVHTCTFSPHMYAAYTIHIYILHTESVHIFIFSTATAVCFRLRIPTQVGCVNISAYRDNCYSKILEHHRSDPCYPVCSIRAGGSDCGLSGGIQCCPIHTHPHMCAVPVRCMHIHLLQPC